MKSGNRCCRFRATDFSRSSFGRNRHSTSLCAVVVNSRRYPLPPQGAIVITAYLVLVPVDVPTAPPAERKRNSSDRGPRGGSFFPFLATSGFSPRKTNSSRRTARARQRREFEEIQEPNPCTKPATKRNTKKVLLLPHLFLRHYQRLPPSPPSSTSTTRTVVRSPASNTVYGRVTLSRATSASTNSWISTLDSVHQDDIASVAVAVGVDRGTRPPRETTVDDPRARGDDTGPVQVEGGFPFRERANRRSSSAVLLAQHRSDRNSYTPIGRRSVSGYQIENSDLVASRGRRVP